MTKIEEKSHEDSQSSFSDKGDIKSLKGEIEPEENLRKDSVQNDQTERVSEKQIKVFEVNKDKNLNLRAKIWLIICKVEELKEQLLDEFQKSSTMKKHRTDFRQSCIDLNKKSRPITKIEQNPHFQTIPNDEDADSGSDKGPGFSDQESSDEECKEQNITNPDDLYAFFRDQRNETLEYKIKKDL